MWQRLWQRFLLNHGHLLWRWGKATLCSLQQWKVFLSFEMWKVEQFPWWNIVNFCDEISHLTYSIKTGNNDRNHENRSITTKCFHMLIIRQLVVTKKNNKANWQIITTATSHKISSQSSFSSYCIATSHWDHLWLCVCFYCNHWRPLSWLYTFTMTVILVMHLKDSLPVYFLLEKPKMTFSRCLRMVFTPTRPLV